jgi:hypothetical protein
LRRATGGGWCSESLENLHRKCMRKLATRTEHPFLHLMMGCGRQGEKHNEINSDFSKWCGREDSNLHGLPR